MNETRRLEPDGNGHGHQLLAARMAAVRDDVGWATLLATMCTAVELIQETCAVMALPRLARIGRAALGVLERLQADEIVATPDMLGDVLAAVDAIDGRLSIHGDLGRDSAAADDELVARLVRWRATRVGAARAEPPQHDRARDAMVAMLLDEIRERLCELALMAHYLTLFPWTAGGRAAAHADGRDN